eukprot:TRINITY_DN65254_c0_g1_i1.p2 TRINITY_DN65254_c0_g1~~TRINITY_DN65254_c0_g1_i1.p2  ORF type:complete len:283 (+),score=94.13 TRINITY_DN65254_c0_g1_i1:79-849(+)
MRVVLLAAGCAAAGAALPPGAGCGMCNLPKFQGADAHAEHYGTNDGPLVASRQTWAQHQSQCVRIPYAQFGALFKDPTRWCTWNGLFGPVQNTKIEPGYNLTAQFNIIPNVKWPAGTVLAPPHIKYAKEDADFLEYGWIYQFNDQAGKVYEFGRHNYAAGATPDGNTCLVSWEKAAGPYLNQETVANEVGHTLFCATKQATDGARCLEEVFMKTGGLADKDVRATCHQWANNACDQPAAGAKDCFRLTYPEQHPAR